MDLPAPSIFFNQPIESVLDCWADRGSCLYSQPIRRGFLLVHVDRENPGGVVVVLASM